MEFLVVKRLASSFVGNWRAFCGSGQAIGKAVAPNWKHLIIFLRVSKKRKALCKEEDKITNARWPCG